MFIEKNGPGIHHIAYEVADIEAAIATLLADGASMIDERPRHGAHGIASPLFIRKAVTEC